MMNLRFIGGIILILIGIIPIFNAIRVEGVAEEDIFIAKALWLVIGSSLIGCGYFFGIKPKPKISKTN